jgi:serine/threonine protein kinase
MAEEHYHPPAYPVGPPPPDPPEGIGRDTYLSGYWIRDFLGAGALGSTWRALGPDWWAGTDLAHLYPEYFAITFLNEKVTDDASRARFRDRAEIARGMGDPHIMRTYDYGFYRDQPYIVTELPEAWDLRTVLRKHPAGLPAGKVLRYAVQAAKAIEYAHSRNVIHGDMKPANLFILVSDWIRFYGTHWTAPPPGQLFIQTSDRIRVSGFGIAKGVAATRPPVSPDAIPDSLAYLAPERWLGGPASRPADQYALGCVLHEMLTGRPLFSARDWDELRDQHASQVPEPPEGPPALVQVMLRLLEKDPANRFPTARDLLQALGKIRLPEEKSGTGPGAKTPAPDSIPKARALDVPEKNPARTRPGWARRLWDRVVPWRELR